jgi:hypothetical protein
VKIFPHEVVIVDDQQGSHLVESLSGNGEVTDEKSQSHSKLSLLVTLEFGLLMGFFIAQSPATNNFPALLV